jgi:cytochrome d ubiquinol oxidase subunit I
LNQFEHHPPVKPLFFGFRLMVGIGLLMLVVSWYTTYRLWRSPILTSWHLKGLIAMGFSGWVATLAGWYVTEIGRQPWLVQGVLKTADAVTQVPATHVGLSLALYSATYVVMLLAYLKTLFLMARRSVAIEEITTEERLSMKGLPA